MTKRSASWRAINYDHPAAFGTSADQTDGFEIHASHTIDSLRVLCLHTCATSNLVGETWSATRLSAY